MNKINIVLYHVCVALCIGLSTLSYTEQSASTPDAIHTLQKLEKNPLEADETVLFDYTNEDIINIINQLATLNNKEVFLPQGAQALSIKVTYHAPEPLSLENAWNQLISFLSIAGYSVIDKQDTYTIVKTNKEVAREGLPVFIGADILNAPKTDEWIVYVHYFSNMKAGQEGSSEIQEIIKTILPDDIKYEIDANKNALIIAARTRDVIALLGIIDQLDRAGFKEKLEFIKLHNTSAKIVADLFNENILQQQDPANRYRLDARKKTDSHFFSPKTRIIADERTNALIVIGHEQAIDRLKDFITRYIDVEIDSGKSILHVYHLQYLEAQEFAPVLDRIVKNSDIGRSGQARGDGRKVVGPERYFDDVIIAFDKPDNADETKYYGGNNLIIAARSDDWAHIKQIIEELDTPRPQVFLEILIADLTVEDSRLLGALTRNPSKIPIINMTNFQSAQLPPGVVVDGIKTTAETITPVTIAGDMAALITTDDAGNLVPAALAPPIQAMEPGSTAITLSDNDGKTWSILQILNTLSHSKILSHPHIVGTNGKKAFMKIGQERLVDGDLTGSIGSNTVRKKEKFTADLTISITPRISSANTVNLDVSIDIEEFLNLGNNSPKATRSVKTNANVTSESILTLGGLIRSNSQQGLNATPLLSDVPILGWFFKNRSGDIRQNNLTVFISPTIVQPRLRKGIGTYTQDYISLASTYADESVLFDSLKDPVTRLFFRTDATFDRSLDEFVDNDQFITPDSIAPTPVPRAVSNNAKASPSPAEDAKIEATLAHLLKDEPNPFTQAKSVISEKETIITAREYNDTEKAALLKELLEETENPFA